MGDPVYRINQSFAKLARQRGEPQDHDDNTRRLMHGLGKCPSKTFRWISIPVAFGGVILNGGGNCGPGG